MISQNLIDILHLQTAPPIGPSESNKLRIFKWPEFAAFHELIMECSMRGDRLPKKSNLEIYIANAHEFHGFIMTNEMLLENMDSVRAIIQKASQELPS